VGPAAVLSIGFALLALYVSAFNGWLYVQRRSEPVHFWLAVAALGVAVISSGQAMAYESSTLAEVEFWQRFQFTGSFPLVYGFVRFSTCFLEVDGRRFERIALLLGAAGAGLAVASPWLFTGAPRSAPPPWGANTSGIEIDAVGMLLFASYLGLFLHLIRLYARNRERIEEHGALMLGAICIWAACGMNDMVISLGGYGGPYLISAGYTVFVVAFSAILIRRFVRSMEEAERSADALQDQVDLRTAELRERELQLAHGERMATLGTLAASVAHEINNPAAYVTSNLNQLEKLLCDEDPRSIAEAREIVAECQEGAGRIRSIVTDLLNVARRSDGTDVSVDLVRVVESTLPIVRNEARYRAELVTELNAVPPVLGDPRLLGQVVLNLALNGIQAAAESGRALPRVSVETSFDDGSVWLVVRDNGPGVPEEVLPHIFDAFVTTKREGESTGLGLAVSRQIVERHRGRIELSSDATGTTVIVELPAAPASRSGASRGTSGGGSPG
jgi:signal transduction histidine kinase